MGKIWVFQITNSIGTQLSCVNEGQILVKGPVGILFRLDPFGIERCACTSYKSFFTQTQIVSRETYAFSR